VPKTNNNFIELTYCLVIKPGKVVVNVLIIKLFIPITRFFLYPYYFTHNPVIIGHVA